VAHQNIINAADDDVLWKGNLAENFLLVMKVLAGTTILTSRQDKLYP
jgi:hypothetical protein